MLWYRQSPRNRQQPSGVRLHRPLEQPVNLRAFFK